MLFEPLQVGRLFYFREGMGLGAQEFVTLLNEIGGKLAEPAKHVLEIWIRQIMIFGIVDIVVGIIFFFVGLIFFNMWLNEPEESKNRRPPDDISTLAFLAFIGFIGGVFGLGLVLRGFMLLLNPEYWFVTDVLGFVFGG
jgi:hypothetical protein